ncbi:MAG TPA: ATP-binding protein [Candidatus Thermoplasmatota archaeon]|nr:ATP-binding protein [Candidatus Thermoplasmatota archaeon]
MPSLSLKTRISLSLLVAFALVAGIATAFAQAGFRDMETRHAHDDSQARVDAIAQFVDARFLALGQDAKAAANDAGNEPAAKVLEEMERAGFGTAIVLSRADEVAAASGEAQANGTLRALMLEGAPPRDYPATVFSFRDGWFIVSSRSTDLKTAVVGAMSQSYLSDSFLVDALIHPEYGHALVLGDGAVVAASANYAGLASGSLATVATKEPGGLDAHVEGRVPTGAIEARVDAMTVRFVLSMAIAFGIGGGVTILLVAYAFRPLDRITEAARRMGRGEEDLGLPAGGKDELGELADVLSRSARAIGQARRAEAVRATEARLAAEDFELAVGDLSRQVGEAETPDEVASKLTDALLRVTTVSAVLVRFEGATLAVAGRDGIADGLQALYETEPSAWHVVHDREGDLEIALGPAGLPQREARKVEILAAQAGIAIHRAQAAVDLQRAKAQKETFLDILSHDLKNPLAVARGRVELLARKHPDASERLGQVEASLDRATRIIEEAVLLSKLEKGDTLERIPVDLAALVEESAASLRPLAAPRGVRIAVDAPANAMWPANRLLQRAVENLVSNAIKWSPQEGEVEVRIVPDDHACLLLVVDHGVGIPDEDKRRLFARFERADRTGVKGTGLGLAIAQRVTQMHGGSIRIEDTPGGGTTFVMEIPHSDIAPLAVGR